MSAERDIEKTLRLRVEDLGGIAYKFVSPGRRGVLDRLCVLPYGVIFFVEVKAPGKKPTDAQRREMARLTRMGHHATWVSTAAEVHNLILDMKEAINERSGNYEEVESYK